MVSRRRETRSPNARNLYPGNQIDGYHTRFALIRMSVDAEDEVVVDAALAFGGWIRALNSRYRKAFRYRRKLHQAASGFRSVLLRGQTPLPERIE